jgi:nicotinate phosphoribosyltransferase
MVDAASHEPAGRLSLFTDLYALTMAQAYDSEGMEQPAVFEMFFRELPPHRNYVIAAGLEDVLAYLETLHFSPDDLAYLRHQGGFGDGFLDRLQRLRFTGDVYAIAEGTPVFPNEPVLQVVAPLIEGQLIETLLLNQVHFQSVVATKAARMVTAAAGRALIDFGSRRAHGIDAALKVARTSYLVGATGTSLVLAGRMYGIPIFGTMAHSYIQSHDDELAAFAAFAEFYPETTLLVDTYGTLEGLRKVVALSQRLGQRFTVRAIRLDSGDLGELAGQARRILDEAGLRKVQIFASSDLDEYRIAELLATGTPIDGFGVGTRMAVAADAPHVDMAYKLVEYAGRPRVKLASHKVIYPGRKQVFRTVRGGLMVGDTIGRHNEALPGEPLLRPVMRGGERLPAGRVSLDDARRHALRERDRLPDAVRRLEPVIAPYPVETSDALVTDLEVFRMSLKSGTGRG